MYTCGACPKCYDDGTVVEKDDKKYCCSGEWCEDKYGVYTCGACPKCYDDGTEVIKDEKYLCCNEYHETKKGDYICGPENGDYPV